ncbi:MAG: hypothetical protein ACT4PT_04060 [Methanobacteriota archaeon]
MDMTLHDAARYVPAVCFAKFRIGSEDRIEPVVVQDLKLPACPHPEVRRVPDEFYDSLRFFSAEEHVCIRARYL